MVSGGEGVGQAPLKDSKNSPSRTIDPPFNPPIRVWSVLSLPTLVRLCTAETDLPRCAGAVGASCQSLPAISAAIVSRVGRSSRWRGRRAVLSVDRVFVRTAGKGTATSPNWRTVGCLPSGWSGVRLPRHQSKVRASKHLLAKSPNSLSGSNSASSGDALRRLSSTTCGSYR